MLKQIQNEAISFRAEVAASQAANQGQVEEMRAHVVQTQVDLKELNALGVRLREVATTNDATVAQARLDIDRIRADTLAVMAAELEKLKEQAVTNQSNLNLLYHETRQGLQEIEVRVNAAVGSGAPKSTYPLSPTKARAEPTIPVPPSWSGGGIGGGGAQGFGGVAPPPPGAGFTQPGGGSWNLHPCLHRKDIEVPPMAEEMTREEFLLWRDKLIDFREATGSAGITPLLESLHTRRPECSVMDAVGLANSKGVGNGNTTQEEIGRASAAMYAGIRSKINATARSLCLDIRDRNGAEMHRRLSSKYAPATEQPHLALYDQIQDCRELRCKSFEESYNTMKKFERMVKEHARQGPAGARRRASGRAE